MPTCSICKHKKKREIEKAVISGASLRDIARQFEVSKDAVDRHSKSCAAKKIEKAVEKSALRDGMSLLDQVGLWQKRTEQIYMDAQDGDEPNPWLALKAIDQAMKQLDTLGKLTGAFQKDQDNQKDVERKTQVYERAITRVIEAARAHGVEVERGVAIEGLVQYFPDISQFCH